MCDPVTIGLVIGATYTTSRIAGSLMQPSNPKLPAAPQEAKSPDVAALRGNLARQFGMAGNAGTYSTGPGGLSSAGTLGRNTLLGG